MAADEPDRLAWFEDTLKAPGRTTAPMAYFREAVAGWRAAETRVAELQRERGEAVERPRGALASICGNMPCPVCGDGPSGEWSEGSEVRCDGCGVLLGVVTCEPCMGTSTFEVIPEGCDACDGTGMVEDAEGDEGPCKKCPGDGIKPTPSLAAAPESAAPAVCGKPVHTSCDCGHPWESHHKEDMDYVAGCRVFARPGSVDWCQCNLAEPLLCQREPHEGPCGGPKKCECKSCAPCANHASPMDGSLCAACCNEHPDAALSGLLHGVMLAASVPPFVPTQQDVDDLRAAAEKKTWVATTPEMVFYLLSLLPMREPNTTATVSGATATPEEKP